MIDGRRDRCLICCRLKSAEFLVVSEYFVDEVVLREFLASNDWGLQCNSWMPRLKHSTTVIMVFEMGF